MTSEVLPPQKQTRKRKRPLVLTILTLLLILRALLMTVLAALLFIAIWAKNTGSLLEFEAYLLFLFYVVGVVVLLVAAYGLWLLRPWAWQTNMILMGFLLIIGLWTHFNGPADWSADAMMLLNVVIVFYLVQHDVRDLFLNAGETSAE